MGNSGENLFHVLATTTRARYFYKYSLSCSENRGLI